MAELEQLSVVFASLRMALASCRSRFKVKGFRFARQKWLALLPKRHKQLHSSVFSRLLRPDRFCGAKSGSSPLVVGVLGD